MIELNGAGYSYGDTPLLAGVDLSLPPGSFHFLTGPSGAGKTTLLKLCYGELKPEIGAVTIDGQDTRALDRNALARTRRRIGIVHQDCQFLDHLTLAENIALPLQVTGQEIDGESLAQLLAWTGLADRAKARPPQLSGGERQRAALARAVMIDPDILIADEPTGNIDWEMSQRLLSLLVELNRLGKTILVATHDIALIRATKPLVAARVLRLAGGAVQAAGAEL